MSKPLVRLTILLMSVLLFTACASRQLLSDRTLTTTTARLTATIQTDTDESGTLSANLKFCRDRLIRISFLMPVLRSEAARLEFTPDSILYIDRTTRRYAHLSYRELAAQRTTLPMIDTRLSYRRMQAYVLRLLDGHADADAPLLLPPLRLRMQLTDINVSDDVIEPTPLPRRYTPATIAQLLQLPEP
ncbi:MAG: DUF4292 domain-containing protein [Prevotellaceae bacterium]|jgi:hypothetical protein|nr:DUF4292 domain-containing protein [Prevotellaceae bacterium]